MDKHGVALVLSHSERWPYAEDVTAGFVYVRLHGPGELYASPYDRGAVAADRAEFDLIAARRRFR